jgi:hypothetical protein
MAEKKQSSGPRSCANCDFASWRATGPKIPHSDLFCVANPAEPVLKPEPHKLGCDEWKGR